MAHENVGSALPIAGSVASAEAPLNLNGIPVTPVGDQVMVSESQIPEVLANSSRGAEVLGRFGLTDMLARPVGDFFDALRLKARELKTQAGNALVSADTRTNIRQADLAQAKLYKLQSEQALAEAEATQAAKAAAAARFGEKPRPEDQLRNIIAYSPDQAAVKTAEAQLAAKQNGPQSRQPVDPAVLSYLGGAQAP